MEHLFKQFEEITGNPVIRIRVDVADFQNFKTMYKDDREGVNDQKFLEYYISYKYLDLQPSDTYIDIAAQNCPFAFFLREKYKCKVYRQDLYYLKKGIHGDDIGGDASNMPLKDESISKVSLHNSFEHFEENSDIHFIQETQRVLTIGGKLLIVPFFFEDKYRIEQNSGWVDKEGKKHLWGEGARFSRLYDVEQFNLRIVQNSPAFKIQFYVIENLQEISPDCYGQMFVIFEKNKSVAPRNWLARLLRRR